MLGYDTCMAETSTVLMSIKMRASLEGRHISGAERIVEPHLVPSVSSELATRALRHEKGVPDSINIATTKQHYLCQRLECRYSGLREPGVCTNSDDGRAR